MNIITLGATNFSSHTITLIDTFEIDEANTLYYLRIGNQETYTLYNIFTGYFEFSESYLVENSIKTNNDFKNYYDSNIEKFYQKILSEKHPKFLLYSGSQYNIYENLLVSKISKNYNKLLKDIENDAGRGAKNWFLNIFRICFFGYYPEKEVYLEKDGFTFPDFKKSFGYTFKTRNKNFNTLKELGLIKFNLKKNKISGLAFNLKMFPIPKANFPSIFHSALYQIDEAEKYLPINSNLEKINQIIRPLNYENEGKTDYLTKQIENEIIGSKSEKIALEFEIQRLRELGFSNADEKTKIVSENSKLGYDIISIEENREKRYIEVKTLKREFDIYSFHLTSNELEKTKELENYYIYLVILTKHQPEIKILKANNLENSNFFKVIPKDYKVYLKF